MKKLIAICSLVLMTLFAPLSYAHKGIDFVFKDTHNKVLKLTDYKGKWVLVNFWATWCPRCWAEFPLLSDLNGRKDFVVIGVALDYAGDTQSVLTAITRYHLDYPQVLGGDRRSADMKSPVNQVGPVDFFPVSYLYNPSGELIMFIPGMISKEKILTFIVSYKS